MTKTRSVSFIETFPSFAEAQAYAARISAPSVVVHLHGNDGREVFTVCDQGAIDAVQEELNAVVKELAAD